MRDRTPSNWPVAPPATLPPATHPRIPMHPAVSVLGTWPRTPANASARGAWRRAGAAVGWFGSAANRRSLTGSPVCTTRAARCLCPASPSTIRRGLDAGPCCRPPLLPVALPPFPELLSGDVIPRAVPANALRAQGSRRRRLRTTPDWPRPQARSLYDRRHDHWPALAHPSRWACAPAALPHGQHVLRSGRGREALPLYWLRCMVPHATSYWLEAATPGAGVCGAEGSRTVPQPRGSHAAVASARRTAFAAPERSGTIRTLPISVSEEFASGTALGKSLVVGIVGTLANRGARAAQRRHAVSAANGDTDIAPYMRPIPS
jgi:hypothetical protein